MHRCCAAGSTRRPRGACSSSRWRCARRRLPSERPAGASRASGRPWQLRRPPAAKQLRPQKERPRQLLAATPRRGGARATTGGSASVSPSAQATRPLLRHSSRRRRLGRWICGAGARLGRGAGRAAASAGWCAPCHRLRTGRRWETPAALPMHPFLATATATLRLQHRMPAARQAAAGAHSAVAGPRLQRWRQQQQAALGQAAGAGGRGRYGGRQRWTLPSRSWGGSSSACR